MGIHINRYASRRLAYYVSKNRIYIYPALIVVIFFVFVSLKISGTSIGVYHDLLYGNTKKDSNLLYGKPRPIRSDEWLVATQLAIAQESNGFNRINNNLLGGRDTSILMDVPNRDWSSLFKPENFSFFILPFEYAFAFKWWLLLAALLISSYAFALKILGKRVLIATLFSITVSCAPFVFWWYQLATLGTLTYGFLILLVGIWIIEKSTVQIGGKYFNLLASGLIKSLVFAYLLICFAFIFYPPFQIPVAISVAFFLLGYLLNQKLTKKDWLAIGLPVILGLILSGVVIGLFVASRTEPLGAITGTSYPGKRIVTSGGYDIKKLLATYLQPLLQSNTRGANYISNQSEASNFILSPLYFIIPLLSLFIFIYARFKRFDWVLFSLIICNLLLLAFLFVPGINVVAKLFFLHLVPQDRLLIGVGFLTSINLVYAIKIYSDKKIQMTTKIKVAICTYLFFLFGAIVWAGLDISQHYPLFISNKLLLFAFLFSVLTGVGFILFRKFKIGMGIIALFTLGSVCYIHPLYIGLGPIYRGEIVKTIQELSPMNATWASAENIFIEHFPQIAGRSSITGVSVYPNNAFWKAYSGMNDNSIYNRYAHITYGDTNGKSLLLVGGDSFIVSKSCSNKVSGAVDFIVSTVPLNESCNHLLKVLSYPSLKLYFYRQ